MQRRVPPRLNRAGRPIWFVFDHASEGAGRPVTRQGCLAFVLAGLWIVACGTIFPSIMVATREPRWLLAMIVVGGAGLAVFGRLVFRHS